MACCITGCKNVYRLLPPESEVSVHRVPRSQLENNATVKEFIKPNRIDKNMLVICSDHYVPSDFFIASNGRKILRKNAVPSRNLGNVEEVGGAPPENFLINFVPVDDVPISLDNDYSIEHVPLTEEQLIIKTEEDTPSDDKQTARFIQAIHSYSMSPTDLKRKYDESQKKLLNATKQLKAAKSKISRLQQKVSFLKKCVAELKEVKQEELALENYLKKLNKI